MNKFFCKLSGGHRYADANTIVKYDPISRNIFIANHCIKCGAKYCVHFEEKHFFKLEYKPYFIRQKAK